MAQKLEIPAFSSESEEAQWWFDNRDAVSEEFALAAREGRLGHGRVAGRANASGSLLALDPEDVELAKTQATRRGLAYQAYIKIVLHNALLNDEKQGG